MYYYWYGDILVMTSISPYQRIVNKSSIICQDKSNFESISIDDLVESITHLIDCILAKKREKVKKNMQKRENKNRKKNIPEGWTLKKLSDVLDYERPDNYLVKSTSYNDKSKTPVLTANKSFVLGYTDEDFGIYNNTPAIIFDDFTTDSKFVDFSFKIKSSAIKILKEKSKDTDLRFIFEKMKSVNFPTGSHKRFYISQYQNMEILLPSIVEQQKIAEILGTVDEDIAKTQEVIDATEKLKKGLVSKLFFDHVNSKRYNIRDICEVTSSKRVMVADYVDDGVPFYRSTEIIRKSKGLSIANPLYISVEKFNFFKDRFGAPESGDVLITAVGTIGDVYLVQKETFYFKDGNTVWLRKINDTVLPEYLAMILSSSFYREKLNSIAGGSSQKALTIEKLESVEVPIPSISEQESLVKILSAIDSKITVNKKLKDKLTLLKNGLMQDLLSGEVRINI